MSEVAAGVLLVRPAEQCIVPGWTGVAIQSWFLDLIGSRDRALANYAHEGSALRPYTVSSLMSVTHRTPRHLTLYPNEQYGIRITTLTTELTQLWFDHLVPSLSNSSFTLTGERFYIDGMSSNPHWSGRTTISDLVQAQMLRESLPRAIELEFDSPTAFKSSHGFTVAFPIPALVFGNLIDRWNALNPVKLQPDTHQFIETCIAPGRFRLDTDYITLGSGDHRRSVTGCLGRCRYAIRRDDRYWIAVIHALAEYAFYAGVGLETTTGLGRVKLIEDVV